MDTLVGVSTYFALFFLLATYTDPVRGKVDVFVVVQKRPSRARKILKKKMQMEEKCVGDVPYLLVTLSDSLIEKPNKKMSALFEKYRHSLLLQEDLKPQLSVFSRLDEDKIGKQLLAQTVAQMLQQAQLPLYQKNICLVDYRGQFSIAVEPFLWVCPQIKILSANCRRYQALSQKMMEEFGASLSISDFPDKGAQYTTVVELDPLPHTQVTGDLLFSQKKEDAFSLGNIQLLQGVGELPAGITPCSFLAALSQFDHRPLEGWYEVKSLIYQGQEWPFQEVVGLLERKIQEKEYLASQKGMCLTV